MGKRSLFIWLFLTASAASGPWALVHAEEATSSPSNSVPVTVGNFPRAESDLYMANSIKDGALGKLTHNRELTPVDKQTVIRMNRDTLYSFGVFDLDASPVTITMPDSGGRFMSLQIINEDHYVPAVYYGAGAHTLTRENCGTRYVVAAVRTLVDPLKPDDLNQVHALQDAIKTEQASVGTFDIPKWDHVSQTKIRDALLVLAQFTDGFRNAFGAKGEVDPVRHLIATAAGWGGNPDKDAIYLNFAPPVDDGTTVYKLDVKDVPVEAFWSVTVYNAKGYLQENKYNAYSVNNLTATKGSDGAVDVQFGGCDGKIPNCLPIVKGWNYTVRLYRPEHSILDGSWKFPEPVPADASSATGASSGTGKD